MHVQLSCNHRSPSHPHRFLRVAMIYSFFIISNVHPDWKNLAEDATCLLLFFFFFLQNNKTRRSSLFGEAICERKCKSAAKRSEGVTSQRNSRFIYSIILPWFQLDFSDCSLSLFRLFRCFSPRPFCNCFVVAARENKRVVSNSKKPSFKYSTRDKCNRPFSCKWDGRREKMWTKFEMDCWRYKGKYTKPCVLYLVKNVWQSSNYFHSNRRWFLHVWIVLNLFIVNATKYLIFCLNGKC